MKQSTKLRLIGGGIILLNLFIIGWYNIKGIPVLMLTIGVAFVFEAVIKFGKKG
ncbi:MAG: hypothetical protein KAR06_04440 [Deltaproteobacteria bacterium]|nr:hypothetical protein [Deltaproteobacteria bacterium]